MCVRICSLHSPACFWCVFSLWAGPTLNCPYSKPLWDSTFYSDWGRAKLNVLNQSDFDDCEPFPALQEQSMFLPKTVLWFCAFTFQFYLFIPLPSNVFTCLSSDKHQNKHLDFVFWFKVAQTLFTFLEIPFRRKRMLQQNVCHLFVQGDGTGELQSVFATLLQAELVPATVNDYREKLLHLRKLRCDIALSAVPSGSLQEVSHFGHLAFVTFPYSYTSVPFCELQSF